MWIYLTFLCTIYAAIVNIHPHDKHGLEILRSSGLRESHHRGVFQFDRDTEAHLVPRRRDLYVEYSYDDVKIPVEYGDHDDLLSKIDHIVDISQGIAETFDIGFSHGNRVLRGIRITVDKNSQSIRPVVRLVGNQHGDEVVGRELLIRFAEYIVNHQTTLIDTFGPIVIEMLPSMNPDGFFNSTRGNMFGHDLNRAFPSPYANKPWNADVAPKEVVAVMKWLSSITPNHVLTLVGNLHGGAEVCNYPRDTNSEHKKKYTSTKEDILYREVCMEYSRFNPDMYHSRLFDDGITNGADWYPLDGGLQDWIYDNFGVMSVTVEVSSRKVPSYLSIESKYFPANFGSLTHFVALGKRGCFGRTTHENVGVNSTIATSYNVVIFSNANGDFGRIMEEGRHQLTVTTTHGIKEITCEVHSSEQTVIQVNV
jgi:hypothetical protein